MRFLHGIYEWVSRESSPWLYVLVFPLLPLAVNTLGL